MAKRNRNRQTDEHEETTRARLPRRTKRLKRRLGWLLLVFVGVIAAAPTIVSQTSLRNTLPGIALPSGWRIESQQAALGWISSQALTGVTVTCAEGTPLLTVESLTLPKSLLALALNQSDLGKLELVRPVVYLETRPEGSNWEDFLSAVQREIAAQQEQQVETAGRRLQLQIEIVDGTVRGVDRVTEQQWSLTAANVMATVGEATQVSGSAQLATANQFQPGNLKLQWRPTDAGQQQLELLAERLPLGPLEPWLARVLPGGELSGTLSVDGQLSWSIDPQRGLFMQTTGRIEASQLDLTAGVLRGDRLSFQQVSAPWKLSVADGQLTIEKLAVDADRTRLETTGSLTLAELQSLSYGHLPKGTTKVAGKIDLAQVTAMLPRTLQLRQGVHIDAGHLEFDLAAKPSGADVVWSANAALQNVAGSDGQRKIRWKQPIEAALVWHDSPAGLQMEQLALTAPFAKAFAQTRQDAVEGNFELDFDRLSQELGQFVDLHTWQLRGLGEGTFKFTRQANQQFAAESKVDLTDLHVTKGTRQIWVEQKLQVQLRATGTEHDFSPRAIATGTLQLRGPRDQLEVELLAPVDFRAAQRSWLLQVEGNGPLELWAGRLRPWLASMPEQLEGDAQLRARVQVATDRVEVTESTGSVVQLRVQSGAMSIDEPRVEFAGNALWDAGDKSLMTREMQLLGSSFSFRARDVAVALTGPGVPTARGNVAFRADLERLAAMGGLVGQSRTTWPQGSAVGQIQLTSSGEQLQADFGVTIKQLQLVRTTAASGAVYGAPEIVWTEPQLEATGVAKYLLANDRIELDNLQVRGETLRLNSSASLDRVRTEGRLQASGLVEYDPNELAKLVASYTGQGMQLQGDRQVRFQIAGSLFDSVTGVSPHWSHRWNATAEAGWSSAGAYGLPLGGGRLQGTLREGQLKFAPLDVAVGRGRLTAQPWVTLIPHSEQIFLPKGPLVTDVAISQEVSETMLKYVAPILAGATRAEGQFSVDLDQAEVPLGKPELARVQGRLAVHRLVVSPGPMVTQLATLVWQIKALTKRKQFIQAATAPRNRNILTVAEREIDFQVVEGRVYHRNLEFLIDDVPVRSHGSVGFDQTLALEVEVPIQDKWIEREPALRSFTGQSLRIPIYGTLGKPRIDDRAVANLTKQLLQGAATQAIGNELNRQFEKLLRGK